MPRARQRIYNIKRVTWYWLNTTGKHATEDEEKDEIKTLTAAIQPLSDKYYDADVAGKMRGRGGRFGMGGPGRGGNSDNAPKTLTTVTIEASESVRRKITARADGIIWALSQLPLITLYVTFDRRDQHGALVRSAPGSGNWG